MTSCGSEEESVSPNEWDSLKCLKLLLIFTIWITFCVIINNFKYIGHVTSSKRWKTLFEITHQTSHTQEALTWCHTVMKSKCLCDKAVFTELDFLAMVSGIVDETDMLLSGKNKQMKRQVRDFSYDFPECFSKEQSPNFHSLNRDENVRYLPRCCIVTGPVHHWGTQSNAGPQVPWANNLSLPHNSAHEMGRFMDPEKVCWSWPAATLDAESSWWTASMHVHVCIDCLRSCWASW